MFMFATYIFRWIKIIESNSTRIRFASPNWIFPAVPDIDCVRRNCGGCSHWPDGFPPTTLMGRELKQSLVNSPHLLAARDAGLYWPSSGAARSLKYAVDLNPYGLSKVYCICIKPYFNVIHKGVHIWHAFYTVLSAITYEPLVLTVQGGPVKVRPTYI